MSHITLEQWLAELGRAEANSDGASAQEIVETTRLSLTQVRTRLRALHKDGRLIAGSKLARSIDGKMRSVPAYKIKPSKKK